MTEVEDEFNLEQAQKGAPIEYCLPVSRTWILATYVCQSRLEPSIHIIEYTYNDERQVAHACKIELRMSTRRKFFYRFHLGPKADRPQLEWSTQPEAVARVYLTRPEYEWISPILTLEYTS